MLTNWTMATNRHKKRYKRKQKIDHKIKKKHKTKIIFIKIRGGAKTKIEYDLKNKENHTK